MMTWEKRLYANLPDWAWNLKNKLTGNPYRSHMQRKALSDDVAYIPFEEMAESMSSTGWYFSDKIPAISLTKAKTFTGADVTIAWYANGVTVTEYGRPHLDS